MTKTTKFQSQNPETDSRKGKPDFFRVMTYNIHKGRGMDRRNRIQRVAEILQGLKPDIVALQEVLSVEGKEPEAHQARFIAEALGFHFRIGETRRLRGGAYGNVTLSRFPVIFEKHYDLSHAGREERGCLRTDLRLESGRLLHVYNLHLGTAFHERRVQAQKLFDQQMLKEGRRIGAGLIVGDFNEWIPGLASHLLGTHFQRVRIKTRWSRYRTYPGVLPLLSLDHIYFEKHLELVRAALIRNRKTLLASDHLPVVADFRPAG